MRNRYVLGTSGDGGPSYLPFFQTGLVRQGHTVTQLTLTALVWHHAEEGNLFGPCHDFVGAQDPAKQQCHSDYVTSGASSCVRE